MVNLSKSQNTSDPDAADTATSPADDASAGEKPEPTRRPTSPWDIASALLLTAAMTSVVSLVPLLFGWFYRPKAMFVVAGVLGVGCLVALRTARKRDLPDGGTAWQQMTRTWTDPPGSWPAACLGAVLSFPFIGMFQNGLGPDADSMRLVAGIRHVQRGNFEFLTETQDIFVPHLVMGPVLTLGGAAGARLLTIVSMQALVATIAWLTYRLSGRMSAALGAALALLAMAPFINRALVLPMYPTMLMLGCLGTWFAYRAISENAGWTFAVGGALLLVLAYEAQPVGQLVLAVPLLLLITAPDKRRGLANMLRVLALMALFLVPRILVNLSDGGLSHFRSNRTDYWITEGYLKQIQTDFWGYEGLGESPVRYLTNFVPRLVESLGVGGWATLALATTALIALKGRARWFALTTAGLVVAAMTVNTIQPNPRYFSPLWPGLTVLAGLAMAELLRRRQLALRVLAVGVAVFLGAVGLDNIRDTARAGQARVGAVEERGYIEAASLIDDGRGIIGVRSHILVSANIDLPTYGGHLLSEDEYVTYLTWPSDDEVIEIMERHDIGWVMTTKQRRLDHDYNNTWLVPNYGIEARHLDMLSESPNFCRMPIDARVTIYRLGTCAGPSSP